MRLGIGTYTYMWAIGQDTAWPVRPPEAQPQMDAFELLRRALTLGVKVVQIGPNLPLPEDRFAEIAALARECEIEIELGMKGLDREDILRHLALCKLFGARLLRTVDSYQGAAPDADALARRLAAVLPDLEKAEVRLALENARIPARVMAKALTILGSPWLGITLDPVNSLAIPEGFAEVAETLAPYTICLHVKDYVIQREWHTMGFRVEGRPAGEGQLDVPWILSLLASAGREANAILELWPPWQGDLAKTIQLEQEWAACSVAYLRRLIPD